MQVSRRVWTLTAALAVLLSWGLLTGCKKEEPAPAPTQAPAPSSVPELAPAPGPELAPAPAPPVTAKPDVTAEKRPVESEPATELAQEVNELLAEPEGEGAAEEPSSALKQAADATRELGGLMSKMLREMKPHEADTAKLIAIQERYRPAIAEVFKRGEAQMKKLTEGERVLLQQHGIAMLQELSEDFVGLPAEVVVPIADELLSLVGVETEHQFD